MTDTDPALERTPDMNDPIDPTIVEKAAKAMADDWNPERDPILTAMFCDYAQTALEAVADDLRAEGAATALDLVRADIRAAALIRHYDPTCPTWTNLEVFEQAGIYTSEWLNDLLAYDSEEEQS